MPTANALISGATGKIDYNTAGLLMDVHRFASFALSNYLFKFWWDDRVFSWCSEVWKNNQYIISHSTEFLNDLVGELKNSHDLTLLF